MFNKIINKVRAWFCAKQTPTKAPMKLEAVIVCHRYSDFLSHSLPINKAMFDKIVVVTSPEDKLTQKLAEYWHVECIQTDALQTDKNRFAKGSGINKGLEKLSKDGWVVHLDADIVLPPLFRVILEKLELDPSMIYGADRMMVPNYEAWAEFMTSPKVLNENETWTHLDAFPLGVRVSHAHSWLPIGYLQLWNPAASGVHTYPDKHTSAARGDMAFAELWPRSKRGFIPEVTVFHLESEPAIMGANWDGRKTRQFAPQKPFVVTTGIRNEVKAGFSLPKEYASTLGI